MLESSPHILDRDGHRFYIFQHEKWKNTFSVKNKNKKNCCHHTNVKFKMTSVNNTKLPIPNPGHNSSLYLHSSFSCFTISFFLSLILHPWSMNIQGTTSRSMMFRVRGENMFPSILVVQTGQCDLSKTSQILFIDTD